ncbi:MAG: alpha-mannosidase [Clostridia bacterium]|nr:alpha-mannosidase [Clostridia bacterium]
MKEVHLICNAHIDPIWQWEWEEGAAAALSTFRSAVDLAEEFDYIFCHNEVTLYKYIAEYAPALFARIKKLVREGKWHIMGGWYLQPDCNMPSGESMVRQILMGHRYFEENFGVKPTTAINFDSFGHSSGLPQILRKCGQDSYIITRPGSDPIPASQFWWEGVDGSRVKVGVRSTYLTHLGTAARDIKNRIKNRPEDTIFVLWGVGNHGGGPSRRDLADIEALKKELEGEFTIIHSTPEQFFAKLDPKAVHDKALRLVQPGCYTSMYRIKQKHAELESTLYMVEKLCSMAAMRGLIEYPEQELDEATTDLLNMEFHDVLPGTCIRAGEENGLQYADHALLILNRLRARAYFALCAAEPRAKEGEYPILVYNPHPYEHETEIVCEMMMADQNWRDDIHSRLRLFDASGKELPLQLVKEESCLNLDWRKRFVFRASLKPMDVTRFSLYADYAPTEAAATRQSGDVVMDCTVSVDGKELQKHVEIDAKTGLLRSYRIDGREYLSEKQYLGKRGGFLPVFYKDNPDPWAMSKEQETAIGSDPVPFALMDAPDGPFAGMSGFRIIEDGPIYTAAEAFLSCENTKLRIEYDIYKHTLDVDVKMDVFMNDANRMLRLALPTAGERCLGQTAFGTEELFADGRENVAQRFMALTHGEGDVLALFNRGTYGSIFKDGVLSVSMLRGITYCGHPILDRPIIPTDRFVKKADMGERNFAFRLTVCPKAALERLATEFNLPPYACNVFPAEAGLPGADRPQTPFSIAISERNVVLVTMKKQYGSNAYLLRLLNNDGVSKACTVTLCGREIALDFGKYEVKTLRYDGAVLTEEKALLI